MQRTRAPLGAALIVVALLSVSACGGSGGVEAVADKFAAPTAWTLAGEQITGERLVCISDTPCPSLDRRWEMPFSETPSTSELQALAAAAEYPGTVTGDCRDTGTAIGQTTTCRLDTEAAGFQVSLRVTANAHADWAWVLLSIRP